jgi:hypothetical protein
MEARRLFLVTSVAAAFLPDVGVAALALGLGFITGAFTGDTIFFDGAATLVGDEGELASEDEADEGEDEEEAAAMTFTGRF